MERFEDVVYVDRWFYLTDDAMDSEPLTGDRDRSPGGRLAARRGSLQVRSGVDSGLARVVVEVWEGALPAADTSRAWDWCERWSYPTCLGRERVRDSDLGQAQAGLAHPVTSPGPALVHVRVHEVVEEQPDTDEGEPVDALILIHLWNEPRTP